MHNEDLSQTVVAAQKGVAEHKQSTNIRKITVESIAPVIHKLQEHITFLLGQMNFLRKENNNLITATATQAIIKQNYAKIIDDYDNLSKQVGRVSKEKDVKLQQKQNEINGLRKDIQNIRQQALKQHDRVNQINKNNAQYLQRIQKSKNQQLESVQTLKEKINSYYQQQLIKVERVQQQILSYSKQLQQLSRQKKEEKEQLKMIYNIIALYESDREDVKKMIHKTTFLENNVVMLEDYNKDKKYQSIENQQLKKDIRCMIDEALTPDIRKFLPELIAKLGQLNAFESTLSKLRNNLDSVKEFQEKKFAQIDQVWRVNFQSQKSISEEKLNEITLRLNKSSSELLDKILTNQEIFSLKHNELKDSVQIMEIDINKKLNEQIKSQIQKLDTEFKQYINVWGQDFLDKKKDDIFQLVQESKPAQKKEQQEKMMSVVQNMEPLLKEVEMQLKRAQQSTTTLYQRLSQFNNQIIKFKSDINKETIQNKRIIDSLTLKLHQSRQLSQELSLMTSKLLQTQIISYSLSLNKRFLNKENEVYVTYNDGLILQVNDKNTLYYRRKQMIPEMLKRTVLSQLVKLIDHTILKKPLMGWHNNQFKPSHMFQLIAATYVSSLQENSQFFNTGHQLLSREYRAPLTGDSKQMEKAHPNHKQGSNMPPIKSRQMYTKSIDEGLKSLTSTIRYEGPQERKQYSSRRKSINLKKIQK